MKRARLTAPLPTLDNDSAPVLTATPPESSGALEADLRYIVGELCDLLGAVRSTLFLSDERSGELQARYTYVATDGRLLVRCMQVRGQSIVVVVLADKKVLLGLVWHQLALAEKLMNAE